MNEETFGPIIPVMRVGNDEEAIRYALSGVNLPCSVPNFEPQDKIEEPNPAPTPETCLVHPGRLLACKQAMLTPKD